MNKDFNQIKESIIQILRHHKEGLGISDISKNIKVYRATVSKYLILLHHQGIVSSKRVGPSKLYFLAEEKHQQISSPYKTSREDEEWLDDFIEEIKEELKREILGT